MQNSLLDYCETDRQRQVVTAYINHGSANKAARALNMQRRGVDKMIKRLQEKMQNNVEHKEITFTEAPHGDETIDEILARKRNLYKRKKAAHDFNKLIPVTVNDDKPIALCILGDPHIDDDGCDIDALERDLDVISSTPGMYAGHAGDLTNNWVGRLARLYANQTTTAGQAIKLMEWMLNRAPNLFVINGNHDNWNQGGDLISFVMRSVGGINSTHGGRIALNFKNGKQVRIHARHSFKGTSVYNPTHGQRRAQLWEGNRDHVYVAGHFHTDACSMIPQSDGTCSWSFQVSGYKVIDDYALEGGFTEQRANPSVTLVINPKASNEAELIKPFWDSKLAAKYLTWLRAQ